MADEISLQYYINFSAEQKEEKNIEVEVQPIIVPQKRKKQTADEAKAKNRELKRIYREKNREMLATKRREIYYRKKQEKQ